jgi:hypothetical protein
MGPPPTFAVPSHASSYAARATVRRPADTAPSAQGRGPRFALRRGAARGVVGFATAETRAVSSPAPTSLGPARPWQRGQAARVDSQNDLTLRLDDDGASPTCPQPQQQQQLLGLLKQDTVNIKARLAQCLFSLFD